LRAIASESPQSGPDLLRKPAARLGRLPEMEPTISFEFSEQALDLISREMPEHVEQLLQTGALLGVLDDVLQEQSFVRIEESSSR
jgi:hypothetical protein